VHFSGLIIESLIFFFVNPHYIVEGVKILYKKWDKITTYREKIYLDVISISLPLPLEMHPKDPQMICVGMQPFASKSVNYKYL
jgi:hypothetical protein